MTAIDVWSVLGITAFDRCLSAESLKKDCALPSQSAVFDMPVLTCPAGLLEDRIAFSSESGLRSFPLATEPSACRWLVCPGIFGLIFTCSYVIHSAGHT